MPCRIVRVSKTPARAGERKHNLGLLSLQVFLRRFHYSFFVEPGFPRTVVASGSETVNHGSFAPYRRQLTVSPLNFPNWFISPSSQTVALFHCRSTAFRIQAHDPSCPVALLAVPT